MAENEPQFRDVKGDARETLKDKARDVAEQARQAKDRIAGQAQAIAGEAKQRTNAVLDERKGMAVDALSGFAGALRQTASEMQGRDREMMARYADRAADQIDRFSRELAAKDMARIVRDAEEFGRRQPEVLIGGAVTAGFLLARFLKASRRGQEVSTPASGTTATQGYDNRRGEVA